MVVADKGYDAESNHEYAHDVLGARTAIPVRAASPKGDTRLRSTLSSTEHQNGNDEVAWHAYNHAILETDGMEEMRL
jgi:hypothetical protein